MKKRPTTWIVVADGARSRFFRPSEEFKKHIGIHPMAMPAQKRLAGLRRIKARGRNPCFE